MIYIGRRIPKFLLNAGWREKSAQHLGCGLWMFRLEREAIK